MKTNHIQTDVLMLSLSQGDIAAFEVIYNRYAWDLYKYARRNLSSSDDCKEIIQDVFTYLWANREALKIRNFWGYLLKAVRTRIAEKFRASAVRKNYERHYISFETVFDPFDYDAENVIDPDAIHSMIQRSLPSLPEKCQEAFRMRLNLNLSNAEIAERMNITKGTVEHYMTKAFNHLRESYKQMYRITGFLLPVFAALIPM